MNNQFWLGHAVIEVLNQGETLLQQLGDEQYRRALPVACNASIGGHYRHCLDHFRCLLEAAETGRLNYDLRQRDPAIETERAVALEATRQLAAAYQALDRASLDRPLAVTCKTSYQAQTSDSAASTFGRELMYVVAHAIHHYALIGMMARLLEVQLPPAFGFAPSTLQYQEQLPPQP